MFKYLTVVSFIFICEHLSNTSVRAVCKSVTLSCRLDVFVNVFHVFKGVRVTERFKAVVLNWFGLDMRKSNMKCRI